MSNFAPPQNEPASQHELLQRARALAGLTLGDLADAARIQIPENFKRHKGWTGQLIELWLGATAGSKPQQDFASLGIELKTLPISTLGAPLETTYVCYAPLLNNQGVNWQNCNVRNKLSKVLWLPILAERNIKPQDRMIGNPILWTASPSQELTLQQDWEELMDMISLGHVERINAKIGQALHIRPKAANGQALTQAIGEDGTLINTRPRGFYLRKSFTQGLIETAGLG